MGQFLLIDNLQEFADIHVYFSTLSSLPEPWTQRKRQFPTLKYLAPTNITEITGK